MKAASLKEIKMKDLICNSKYIFTIHGIKPVLLREYKEQLKKKHLYILHLKIYGDI